MDGHWLKDINILIFRYLSGADNSDHPLACGAQTVNPDAVLFLIDDLFDPGGHFIQQIAVQVAFKYALPCGRKWLVG